MPQEISITAVNVKQATIILVKIRFVPKLNQHVHSKEPQLRMEIMMDGVTESSSIILNLPTKEEG